MSFRKEGVEEMVSTQPLADEFGRIPVKGDLKCKFAVITAIVRML